MDAEPQRLQPALLWSVADLEPTSDDDSVVTSKNKPAYAHRLHPALSECNVSTDMTSEFLAAGSPLISPFEQLYSVEPPHPVQKTVLPVPPPAVYHKRSKQRSHRRLRREFADPNQPPPAETTTRSGRNTASMESSFQEKAIEEHELHRKEVLTLLNPVAGQTDSDCSYLFICWGSKTNCKISTIKVRNGADEETVFQTIHETWYAARGWWRKHMPPFNVKDVRRVKIAIAGPERRNGSSSTNNAAFTGMYTLVDLDKKVAECNRIVEGHISEEFPCAYNPGTGFVEHYGCTTPDNCFEELLTYAERQKSYLLTMQPFLKQAFINPAAAIGNHLLEDNNLIKSHQDILAEVNKWHCPRLRELEFDALYIDTASRLRGLVVSSLGVLLVIVVLLAKLAFGDWGIAWNVGCFFVAVASLYLMQRGVEVS